MRLDLVTFYSRNRAVPARCDVDNPEVLHARRIFYEAGWVGCHNPSFVTHRLKDQPEQSFHLIWPYTDMLLHDMGEELADHRPEARATGYAPPLWGVGLTELVSGHTYFLHDKRARSLLEAGTNETYQSTDEALRQPLGALSAGLEFTTATRLGRPLGSFDRPRPNRAEMRRSGRALHNVTHSLQALGQLAHLLGGERRSGDAIGRCLCACTYPRHPA